MYELTVGADTPLLIATYDPETGELYLEFDWDKMLQDSGVWENIRHIDALTFDGNAYPIEIHADDGPRDANGYIYTRDTMENTFVLNIGTGHDPADGTLDFGLSDRVNGRIELYAFDLQEEDTTPLAQPDGLIYALNAGGSEYTASNGVTYAADDLGEVRSYTTSADISGTTDDVLYQSERSELSGGFSYDIAVDNGTYDVELNFAEIWNGAQNAGSRVMDIYIEGTLVINDLDVADEVGFLAAIDLVEQVTVTDGSLTIDAVGEIENAKLSAFSIWQAEDTPPDDLPALIYAVNAGGDSFTASNGIIYAADDFDNGNTYATNAAIAATEDDGLYQSERWNANGFTYELAVDNGTYDVELNFAEIWNGASASGKRIFDLYIEDELVFDNLDISDEVGFLTALDLIGEVEVTDGSLTIRTSGEVQNPKISGFSVWESEGNLSETFAVGTLYEDLSF